MPQLHESDIEQLLIDLLKAKGYQYLYGPDIAPDGETPMRASFEEVVLRDKLEKAVKRLSPSLPYSVQDEAVKTVLRISPPDMQQLATETVLKQAELIAEEITNSL